MYLYHIAEMQANIFARDIHYFVGALSKYLKMEQFLPRRVPSLNEMKQGSIGSLGRVNIRARVIKIVVGGSCIPKFL